MKYIKEYGLIAYSVIAYFVCAFFMDYGREFIIINFRISADSYDIFTYLVGFILLIPFILAFLNVFIFSFFDYKLLDKPFLIWLNILGEENKRPSKIAGISSLVTSFLFLYLAILFIRFYS